MLPVPGQIGDNANKVTVPQEYTENIDLSPDLLEEEYCNVSGTVSNGDNGADYVGERIETRDNIIV